MSVRHASRAAVLLCAGLSACAAPAAWHRAGSGADETAFDLQGCRGEARARMDSSLYYARERAHLDAQRAEAIGKGDTAVLDRWTEFRQRRDFRDLVADCMARKGYRPAPAGAPAA